MPEIQLKVDIDEISVLFSGDSMSSIEKTLSAYYQQILVGQKKDIEFFVNKLLTIINDIFKRVCGDVKKKTTEPKVWTQYYAEIYKFSTTSDYISLVKSLVKCNPTNQDFQLCSKIFDKIVSYVLQKNSEHLVTSHDLNCEVNVSTSEAGKGKIRYIFGRFVLQNQDFII